MACQITGCFKLRYLEAAMNSLDGNDGKDIAFQKLWRTRGGEMKRKESSVPRATRNTHTQTSNHLQCCVQAM